MSDKTGMTFNAKAGEYMRKLEAELSECRAENTKLKARYERLYEQVERNQPYKDAMAECGKWQEAWGKSEAENERLSSELRDLIEDDDVCPHGLVEGCAECMVEDWEVE